MSLDKYKCFEFTRRGRILNMTINVPEKLNSLAMDAHTELSTVFIDVMDDPDSDIVIISGKGKAFSAGGDIPYMQWLRDNPTEFYRVIREAKRFITSILECDKILLAKVNGDAIGLGSTLAVFCDIIFAAEHARFGDPHNNVALITGDGGQIMWPLLMGYGRAKHYLYTGELFSAQKAEQLGLIHEAVPAEELDAKVDAYADRLARMPTQSLRWSKSTINTPLRQMAASMMDIGMAYENLAACLTEDHQEAINAFKEKRKPVFKGR
ncbi:MAG: enoyl-CoA hydratase/isomerase family protein [Porticoccaceae bacterium]|jgi:enoyl-CoA hydratase|nr:enoyl-CoA hydratase/isomerase family protein [Porticoccaceae bacterium]HLS98320.1 enoyl-CoA hydratase/isomerase family protein [Porticoccaceae bacterium]